MNLEHALKSANMKIDLSSYPPVFVIPTHMSEDEAHRIEDQLTAQNANLTFDVSEAQIFIGNINTKRRAAFELRARNVWTEESHSRGQDEVAAQPTVELPRKKLRRGDVETSAAEIGHDDFGHLDSTTEDENETADEDLHMKQDEREDSKSPVSPVRAESPSESADTVKVVRTQWLYDSIEDGEWKPFLDYTVYHGRRIEGAKGTIHTQPSSSTGPTLNATVPSMLSQSARETKSSQNGLPGANSLIHALPDREAILERAKADGERAPRPKNPAAYALGKRRFNRRGDREHADKPQNPFAAAARPSLLREDTSERELDDDLPPLPAWAAANVRFSCQRRTPATTPNDAFIAQLKQIRLARTLQLDDVGVRAYSTAIAALAAYPHALTSPREVLRLPGCDAKIAALWAEWREAAPGAPLHDAARLADPADPLHTVALFYDIWGVGARTAREFYFERGWRDLDDVVEYGWSSLTRAQQIGVKYYDDFLLGIPRAEVERIAGAIRAAAARVRDDAVELAVVGGYRRGKAETSDVDVILSHRDLRATKHLAADVLAALEASGHVTHTLLLAEQTSRRDQNPLPFRGSGLARKAGFDSLDKALVVWQDPEPGGEAGGKNPAPHRRVDIIVSPWRTVGCAVLGWSGGTTFQRDLRRHARHARAWKFDSSGVRDRRNGLVVPLEGPEGVRGSGEGWEEAERRVLEGLGLEWVEPALRCTG